jgi:hypothetical protein
MFFTLVNKSTLALENGDTQMNVLAPNNIFDVFSFGILPRAVPAAEVKKPFRLMADR